MMPRSSLENKQSIQQLFPIHQWFPNEGFSKVIEIAIGLIVGLGAFLAMSSIFYTLENRCSGFSVSQDAQEIFNLFKNAHPFLDLAWKGVWRGYVVLGGPVLEEMLFRGALNNEIKKCQRQFQMTLHKVIRIALGSLLFGACHLSPFQNIVTNLTIGATCTVLGVVLALLKEKRKDLTAPIAAHIIINLAGTL
jgi:membrane protease YdiL (CAAX protease family)